MRAAETRSATRNRSEIALRDAAHLVVFEAEGRHIWRCVLEHFDILGVTTYKAFDEGFHVDAIEGGSSLRLLVASDSPCSLLTMKPNFWSFGDHFSRCEVAAVNLH